MTSGPDRGSTSLFRGNQLRPFCPETHRLLVFGSPEIGAIGHRPSRDFSMIRPDSRTPLASGSLLGGGLRGFPESGRRGIDGGRQKTPKETLKKESRRWYAGTYPLFEIPRFGC